MGDPRAVADSGAPGAVRSRRARLLDLSVGLVEDLRRTDASRRSPELFSDAWQVCLPYRGIFVWQVGGDEVVGDPNQVVYVRGGEGYRIHGPLPGGYAELILTPDPDLLGELAHAAGAPLPSHPLFRRRARRTSPGLQKLRTELLVWASSAPVADPLAAEELVLDLLRAALAAGADAGRPLADTTARILRRAKEYLEAELDRPIRLADIGRAAGASPVYLTDLFRRCEGTSLHRYLTQLRLARALVELPHAGDLTALALELGFSSHSHFTGTFRRAFGCTPSDFRAGARAALPLPAASGDAAVNF